MKLKGPVLRMPSGFGRLDRWRPRKAPGLTVFSMDGQWLKLLHAKGPQHARTITTVIARRVQGQSDEEILTWLREACPATAFEPGTVLIANPTQLTTARLFTLPATDPKEIRDIVELQSEKHTPYAKEEIFTDCRVLGTDAGGYSRVLLVITKQDIVHRAVKLVQGMGWPIERVGLELEGLVNWFRVARKGSARQTTLVAEVDEETTTIALLRNGQLHGHVYVHRSFPLGSKRLISDVPDGATLFIREIQRSLDALEAESTNIEISEAVLTGLVEQIPGPKEQIQQGLGVPVTVVPSFEGCTLSDQAANASEARAQVSFASLLGLVVGRSEVDLTPPALRLHRTFEARARVMMGLGCQLLAGLVLIICLIVNRAQHVQGYHASLTQIHQRTSQEAEALEATLEQLGIIQSWLSVRSQLLDTVAELNQLSPPVIKWESITFTAGQEVIVRGTSKEIPKVFDFVARLEQSPLFSEAAAQRVTRRQEEGEDVTDFEVVCSLASPGAGG